MSFGYDEFAQAIVGKLCSEGQWHRAVSLDLETKIEKKSDFLTGERLLAFGFARRIGGQAQVITFRLKEDTDEAEMALMNEAAQWLYMADPLVLLGYNISGYDFPLLALKLKWYEGKMKQGCKEGEKPVFPRAYWALKDAITRTFIVDMMHLLRFAIARHDNTTPKYRSLAYSVAHPKFASLPLMRRKGLAEAETSEDKGKKIFEMWKTSNPDFERYLEGDVHDVLLLAEEIFGVKPK